MLQHVSGTTSSATVCDSCCGLSTSNSEPPSVRDLNLEMRQNSDNWVVGKHRIVAKFLRTRGHRYQSEMSSPVTAFNSCSRLSPHLAWGTMSIREAYRVATHAETAGLSKATSIAGIFHFTVALAWTLYAKIRRSSGD